MDSYPQYNVDMKSILITIDNALLEKIDRHCGKGNRSSFFRRAALSWLKQWQVLKLEQKQIAGYKRKPVAKGEFDIWRSLRWDSIDNPPA